MIEHKHIFYPRIVAGIKKKLLKYYKDEWKIFGEEAFLQAFIYIKLFFLNNDNAIIGNSIKYKFANTLFYFKM